MRRNRTWPGLWIYLLLPVLGMTNARTAGSILITELMYNPASQETGANRAEWIEIYNSGPTSVDVSGWFIRDEDVTPSEGFPADTLLDAREAVVVVPSGVSITEFQAAWGEGFQVIGHALPLLSNSPSQSNEILQLVDRGGTLVDEVNYDDGSGWPNDRPDGPSIFLLDDSLDPIENDRGENWARSSIGDAGVRASTVTSVFDSINDVGSPGFVVPEPTTIAVLAWLWLTLSGRYGR